MKKNILFILLYNIFITQSYNTSQISIHATTKYARIESTTQIYKSTSGNDALDNIYCLAEESYFVEIIGDYDDYYRIKYSIINGYIKKTDVKEVSSIPSTPYPQNIKIIIGNNCNLRSSPTTKSDNNNVICTIHKGESDIQFIGRVLGEEAIDFGGSSWYYIKYQDKYGYIYNNYVKSITPIYQNTEQFTYLTGFIEKIDNPITHTPSLIIMILLLIPFVGMLVLMYLPKKIRIKQKQHKTHKIIDKYNVKYVLNVNCTLDTSLKTFLTKYLSRISSESLLLEVQSS